ncbi:hypothetical protein [Alkalihalobacterium chitinilyticum]|uniref:Uncharacterized protein n=1 Tax=Alkalihalobacterium chitinilyticum TaxID=2980103 RepID=A0ABT5VHA4_9BACI|nr:hypothetical protein [Alkalihalobacterium chitinilyticum]MDE5414571.1 hypothetical protein [Alkalihalobacterium chitinilyticum]
MEKKSLRVRRNEETRENFFLRIGINFSFQNIIQSLFTEEEILEAFQPFYEITTLKEEVNLNLIYDTQSKLRKFALYNDDDIVQVMKLVKQAQKKQN